MKKAAPYRSRWRSAGIKIVACISHLQGKEIYVLARFTPFVEIGASTFIKACHIGVGTRSLYFRKTILGVIGQYGHRLMNSFSKRSSCACPVCTLGSQCPNVQFPAHGVPVKLKISLLAGSLGSQKTKRKPSAAKATPAGEINVSTAPLRSKPRQQFYTPTAGRWDLIADKRPRFQL